MVWHTPLLKPGEHPKWLGIKPTPEEHAKVKAWSLMGIGVVEMCRLLGKQYGLNKPLSRGSLYHHFRVDIVKRQKPGPKKKTISRKSIKNIEIEMKEMIDTVKYHRQKIGDGETGDED